MSLSEALSYTQSGWHVFPLKPRSKAPLTKNGNNDSTTDSGFLREWWAMWPDAGVGIDLSRSGLVDVAPDSLEWLRTFRSRGLPRTATFASGGGEGHRHHLYRLPAGCPVYRSCKSGEYDILSNGYAVAPPSIHPDTGRAYRWLIRPNELDEIPEAPQWVVDMLIEASTKHATSGATVESNEDEPPVRLSLWAMEWWQAKRFSLQPNGQVDRSETLYAIACELVKAGMTITGGTAALADRDAALGFNKYTGRPDATQRYRETMQRASAKIANEPDDTPNDGPCGKRMEALESRVAELEAKVKDRDGKIYDIFGVLQNETMTTTARIVLVTQMHDLEINPPATPNDWTSTSRGKIAHAAGCKTSAAGDALNQLVQMGAIRKKRARPQPARRVDRATGEVTYDYSTELQVQPTADPRTVLRLCRDLKAEPKAKKKPASRKVMCLLPGHEEEEVKVETIYRCAVDDEEIKRTEHIRRFNLETGEEETTEPVEIRNDEIQRSRTGAMPLTVVRTKDDEFQRSSEIPICQSRGCHSPLYDPESRALGYCRTCRSTAWAAAGGSL